jgi:hypothetical protein
LDKARGHCYGAARALSVLRGILMSDMVRAPRVVAWAALGAVVALGPALVMWGFTIDDALIPVRYARHLAVGQGYTWNVGDAATDGVTPLPWTFVVALLARLAPGDALVVLSHARTFGLAVWTVAAAALGFAVGRAPAPRWAKVGALAALAASLPLAAHAVSGLETPLATALATGAVVLGARPHFAAAVAGLAASLRPELAPWAVTLGAGLAWERAHAPRRAALGAAIAAVPPILVACARAAAFGSFVPLSLQAKPGDPAQGVVYASASFLVAVTPILVLAPRALLAASDPRLAASPRVLVLAFAVHLAAVALVGGDWMPYARLVAPVAPSLAYAFVGAAPAMHAGLARGRLIAALALGAALHAGPGRRGWHVLQDREELVRRARPLFADAHAVAAVDVGWVSAATEGRIVDLAGLTDPFVAALPGGHTSKRVDAPFLLARAPDRLAFYAAEPEAGEIAGLTTALHYAHATEERLASSPLVQAHYSPRTFLPLGDRGAGYMVFVEEAANAP